MVQPVVVRPRRATTLAALEIDGGTMVVDAPGIADAQNVPAPAEATGSVADAPADVPAAPSVRRRGSTTMAAVEASGDTVGAPEEAVATAPAAEPSVVEDNLADVISAPHETLSGIQPHPVDPLTGTPVLPPFSAERIAAGDRGEFFVPPGSDARDDLASSRFVSDSSAEPTGEGSEPDERSDEDKDLDADRDEFPDYNGVDALHDELIALLMRPRVHLRQQFAEEIEALKNRRGQVAAALGAHVQNESLKAHAAGSGGRSGGGLNLMGMLGNGLRRDPTRRLTAEAADIDHALAQRRAFQRRVLDSQYRQMMDCADGMYRAYARLDEEIKQFNQRFASTPEGASLLNATNFAAEDKGISVEAMRQRINDLADMDPTVVKLRNQQKALCEHPDFVEDLKKIDAKARMMATQGDRFRRNLEMLNRNKVDLTGLEGLGEKLEEGMKLTRPLLSQPGEESKYHETLRRITDGLKSLLAAIFGRFAANGPRR